MPRTPNIDVAGQEHKRRQRQKIDAALEDRRGPIERLFSLWSEMLAAGWQDAMYAPKDGTEIEIVELGSTGIHRVTWHDFGHEPLGLCGCFFDDSREGYPCHPAFWRPIKPATIK